MALRFLTLDATGTLLRPRARIGDTYVAHWQQIAASSLPASLARLSPARRDALARAVDVAFPLAFRAHAARSPNFGRGDGGATAARWWRHVVLASLPEELVAPLPRAAQHALASALYGHYASGAAWRVLDDVRPALEALRARGVRMAVVSDFDERLPRLLEELALAPFFEVVTTSWDFGDSKPSRAIFCHTFEALASRSSGLVDASTFLHVGDHVVRDYEGARAAGAHARLLDRRQAFEGDVPRDHVVHTLQDVVPLFQ